jgi:murein DD-endopeptidase MepM/ murein hydrolase activator NlpD
MSTASYWGWRQALVLPAALMLALLPLQSGPASSGVLPLPYAPGYAHQAYGYALVQSSLRQNALARDWLTAAENALAEPAQIAPPYDVVSSFSESVPEARGYLLSLRDGQRVRMDALAESEDRREVFIDLFRATAVGLEHVASALPVVSPNEIDLAPLVLDILEPANYVLRVQPALAAAGSEKDATDYRVRVRVLASPLLGFPVEGVDMRAIWSGFGAERDGGARAHRGVDIFAPRGATALAATDGWVTRVETTRRGGNVVWLQPLTGNMRLYYAHLDTQYVERGQFVLAGEPIGAIGNTGNAATTPPHLHFGVYVRKPGVRGGARDPMAFLR